MHIVSNEFLAYNDSLINLLLAVIVILAITVAALWLYASAAIDKTQELEEEVEHLQRRINRLARQNKTIYK